MCVLDILWSLRDMLWLHRSHHKIRTVGRRSQKSLHRLNSSDGVDIAEVVGVHHVSCYESVHTFRRLPTQEWNTLKINLKAAESQIKNITNPFGNLIK